MAGKRDIVPLDGTNYATWKVQCKMTLMKEGVWNIVNGLEVLPEDQNARLKYYERRDKALAIIVLNVKTSLLYLLGDPVDPKEVWLKIQDQFQKKSWANKLVLKRKLNALKLSVLVLACNFQVFTFCITTSASRVSFRSAVPASSHVVHFSPIKHLLRNRVPLVLG